jgi:hypothetical protein
VPSALTFLREAADRERLDRVALVAGDLGGEQIRRLERVARGLRVELYLSSDHSRQLALNTSPSTSPDSSCHEVPPVSHLDRETTLLDSRRAAVGEPLRLLVEPELALDLDARGGRR